ncbi:MAG: hypothetical protein ACRD8W_00730 [Nitrososphaeraceae archaeon]
METFVKNLLKGVDSEIQMMHGKHLKLFNKIDTRQQLMDVLNGQNIDSNILKMTPNTIKNFDMAIRIGMAKAHFEHTAKMSGSPREFAVRNLEQFFSLPALTLVFIGTQLVTKCYKALLRFVTNFN